MKDRKMIDNLFNGIMVGLLGILLAVVIINSVENTEERKRLKSDIEAVKLSVDELSTGMNERLDSVDKRIGTLIENDQAHTQQIEGLSNNNDTIYGMIKELQDKIKEVEKHIDEVEQAKLKKKAKEAEVLAVSYSAPTSYTTPASGLTPTSGVNYFGDQKETYYNLPMEGVIAQARNFGIEGEYWVRDDGVKMYGDYVIVAANRDIHPMGSLVETSLGTGISLDTGGFAAGNPYQVDVATSW